MREPTYTTLGQNVGHSNRGITKRKTQIVFLDLVILSLNYSVNERNRKQSVSTPYYLVDFSLCKSNKAQRMAKSEAFIREKFHSVISGLVGFPGVIET